MAKEYVLPFYRGRKNKGRGNFGVSMTVPDMAYSIAQLVRDFSVGQLPTLPQLQQYLADEEDVDDVMNTFADVRFADKADMFEQTLMHHKVKKAFLEKVKEMDRFKQQRYAQPSADPEPETQVKQPTPEDLVDSV